MKIPEPIIAPATIDMPSNRFTRFSSRLLSSFIKPIYVNKFNYSNEELKFIDRRFELFGFLNQPNTKVVKFDISYLIVIRS
jgi:hypothetical protein